MWELDYKESWAPKNWCLWTVVLEKTLESPLDCKEIQPVHPKDQSWVFIGKTDVEAETPILWPLHEKKLTHWKRPWCWEGLGAGGEGDDRGWDGCMASPTRWTWVWMNSGSWWQTGRPCVLRFMGLQRVRQDWATELKWTTDFLTVRFVKGGSEVSPIKNFEIKVSSDLSAEAEMWSDLDLRLYPKTVGPPSLCDLVLVSGQWRCYIDICKPVERNNSEAGKQSIIGHLFKI